ncbi:DUF4258 domain-containing protein [Patescibacteria group bacterium]|nr:DUF4258 domain-containing protein [Patescibacteria group bacterium]
MQKHFGGVIWTDHALERLRERGIKQGDAWATWKNPDQSRHTRDKGAWVYYRTWGNQKVEVVATRNKKKQWVILSVWSRTIREKTRSERKIPPIWKRVIKAIFP